MSYLTESESELWDAVVAGLEGEGFDYNPLTTTRSEYLAAALGEPTAYLRKSFARMLAELNGSFGGTLSHLTSSVAHLLDDLAANIGAGGGGEAYVADAITISAFSSVERGSALDGVVDGPTGFVSFWVKADPDAIGVDFVRGPIGNFEMRVDGPDEIHPYQFKAFFYDESGNHSMELDSSEPALDWVNWSNLIFAWDVGHAGGSRRFALYLNDSPVAWFLDFEDGDADFNINYSESNILALMPSGTGIAPLSYADYGLWLNQSIVEADGTISEVNRRKFISAAGKPVDPANWPASPVIKFSGDATTFLTNQGSGGPFTQTLGTITDALTSPSD